jgi:hypothetical protein
MRGAGTCLAGEPPPVERLPQPVAHVRDAHLRLAPGSQVQDVGGQRSAEPPVGFFQQEKLPSAAQNVFVFLRLDLNHIVYKVHIWQVLVGWKERYAPSTLLI